MYKTNKYRSSTDWTLHDARSFLDRVRGGLTWAQEERVLDVGCGPGDITVPILRPVLPSSATLVGCDISPVMIDFANQTYSSSEVSFEIIDITGDSLWTKLKKNSFTKIYSSYALHFLKNYRKVVSNLSALLKEGGQLMLIIPLKGTVYDVYEKLLVHQDYEEFHELIENLMTDFCRWKDPAKEYSKILESESFTNITCDIVEASVKFKSLDNYMELFESVDILMDKLHMRMRSRFLTDCRRIIEDIKMIKTTEEGAFLSYKLLEVVATKK